jgi:hypothetical protein
VTHSRPKLADLGEPPPVHPRSCRAHNARTALALPARPAVQIAEALDRQVWVVSASLTGTSVAISLLDAKGHAALGDMVAIVHA